MLIRRQLSNPGEANSVVRVINRLIEMGEKIFADNSPNRIPGSDDIFHVERNHIEALNLGFLSNSNRVNQRVLSALSLQTHTNESRPCSGL